MNTTTKKIPLTNISLNTNNPRFELVGNQIDAIQIMIKNQPDKLIQLSKDIVEVGMLNPGESIYVTPLKRAKKQFIVLEGNRRITALKILSNPLLVGDNNQLFAKKLKPLSDKFKKNPILEVMCVIFQNQEDANRWIKLKHTGENDGVGVVKWEAQQVARFDERLDGTSPVALQVIDFLRKEVSVSEKLKNKLKDVPASSLERLLKDKNIQDVIGLNIKENKLQTNYQKEEVIKGLTKIVSDLAFKNIKVKDIYSKEDRERYIKTFNTENIPNKDKLEPTAWELISPNQTSKQPDPSTKKSKATPLSSNRKTVIPKDCIFLIKDPRINKIYNELKELDVNTFANAAGVLFRVFIELTMDKFIEIHNVPNANKKQ
jgi:hypothetical protein